jgi:hypothetical protein
MIRSGHTSIEQAANTKTETTCLSVVISRDAAPPHLNSALSHWPKLDAEIHPRMSQATKSSTPVAHPVCKKVYADNSSADSNLQQNTSVVLSIVLCIALAVRRVRPWLNVYSKLA